MRCFNCGKTSNETWLAETRDGKHICPECGRLLNFCEICGSTSEDTDPTDEQLHFEEECFK